MARRSKFVREEWLNAAVDEWRKDFKAVGVKVPSVWVSTSAPMRGNIIGLCYPSNTASDKRNQIWVSTDVNKASDVLAVIAHEMVHASLDCEGGHGREFQGVARKIGFVSPWTQSVPGQTMRERIKEISGVLGDYKGPRFYRSVDEANNGGAQTTRMIKICCDGCGYSLRTTRKWIDLYGPPICPKENTVMHEAN